jgi:hypothetical protein
MVELLKEWENAGKILRTIHGGGRPLLDFYGGSTSFFYRRKFTGTDGG